MECYKTLVTTLCDKYLIAANPMTQCVRVKIGGENIEYVEISVVSIGYHVYMYDRKHIMQRHNFVRFLNNVVSLLGIIE